MIGKSLRQRHAPRALDGDQAIALVTEALASQAEHLIAVRAHDARMIACLVVRADSDSVRLCKALGFEATPGGTGVFGLPGIDVARALAPLASHQREWLEATCGARETKVLLIAGGTALLSLETKDGKLVATAVRLGRD